ncbi:MAG: metallophosphoesterase [Crocinitomicaceae bacterium]|nr:metallophosphoesterase [Crocinitomicaceae bacterium]
MEILLQKLGYKRESGVYSHPVRKVAFVGDFIDRGPKIRETLHIVKDMCDAKNAIAIMGNHEYNAICFHTPHTQKGGFFRDHNLKEIEQHMKPYDSLSILIRSGQTFLKWFKHCRYFLRMKIFEWCTHVGMRYI